jgi:hypothetical protein
MVLLTNAARSVQVGILFREQFCILRHHSQSPLTSRSVPMRAPARRLLPLLVLLIACQENTPTEVAPVASSVTVSPDSVLLAVNGDTARFTAIVRDQRGAVMTGLPLTWESSDVNVATVTGSGLVTSVGVGSATIAARVAGLRGERRAVVRLQLNTLCTIPTAFPTRGAVRTAPSFSLQVVRAPIPPYDVNDVGILDLDGDGDQDVVVASWKLPSQSGYTGTFRAWRNVDGDLSDATATVFGPIVPVADQPLAMLTFDANGDGRDDLYVPQQGFDAAPFPGAPNVLLIQGGGGALVDASGTQLPASNTAVTHWGAAADIDCDGDVDIFDANIGEAGGGPKLLVNNRQGTFAVANHRLPNVITSLTQRYTSAAFCDIDRDGDQDLVLGGWRRPDELLLNDGFGNFRFAPAGGMPAPFFPGVGKATTHVYCIDMDLDGWPDIVTNTTNDYTNGRLTIARNNGDGTFSDVTASLSQSLQQWYSKVFVADMNGDGWPDIVASQPFLQAGSPGGESIFVNAGGFGFSELFLPASVQYGRLFPIDLDGDGRMDLLSIDRGKGINQVLRNTGP